MKTNFIPATLATLLLTGLGIPLVTLGVVACVTTPQGFRQQLASAEASHTAVLDAVDSSLNAGTISSATAADVVAKADAAEQLLVAAKDAYVAGNVGEAQDKLSIAISALTALQDYLRAQGAAK